jgi:Ca2+/Na+ antiporter
MKHFSLSILVFCILLPPFCYIFSVQYVENYLNKKCTKEIEAVFIGDTQPLFEGRFRLKDVINKHVDTYLNNNRLFSWGVNINVIIKTKKDLILYPDTYQEKELPLTDPMKIAAENYNLMNEGLLVLVRLSIKHNSFLSNSILVFYVMIFVMVLYVYYKTGVKKTHIEEEKNKQELDHLIELKKKYTETLGTLGTERHKLAEKLNQLEKEKIAADRNENELIEEIVSLEKKIEEKKVLQNKQEKEIDWLKDQINLRENGSKKKPGHENKAEKSIRKRFNVLYKNLSFNDRTITGYASLTEDMKIKAEEVIHQLNNNASLVSIKRKVFRKKKGDTILEVAFAYMGRLYFSKTKDNKIKVHSIGTKKTQSKDLDFMDNI